MFEIKDKVAVITGGTSGIGYATAEAFLERGAKVVISGRGAKRGEEAAARLREISADVVYRQCDTSDEEDVKALVDFAVDTFGSLDIMFNNAGVAVPGLLDEMSGEDFRRVIDVNLNGVFYGIKYAAIQMKRQGRGGAIVNTSSVNAFGGDPTLPSYGAAKGGVNILTRSAALTYAKDGIRVNTVCPGSTYTGMVNEDVLGKEGLEGLVSLHPVGRLGKPEEIAHGVVFLVENEFVTGVNLPVDGGYTA